MAIDAYLKLEGIKGESQDTGHKDWIEVLRAHWSVIQPRSATASTSGGHTAERAEFTEITLLKLADLSSPILAQTCSMGRTIPSAKLEFFRADGAGPRVKYFEVNFESVLISMVKPHLNAERNYLSEIVNLRYAKIKCQYTQQKISGGVGGNTTGGWDLSANRIA